MSVHTHFDNCVDFLYQLVMEDIAAIAYSRVRYDPPSIIEAFEAIAYIGEYMGRADIFKLAEPAHVILGDTPAVEDIAWVLAEVSKFRAAQPPVRWYTKLNRHWSYLWRSKKFRYQRG